MPVQPHFRITWLFDIVTAPEQAVTGVSVGPGPWDNGACRDAFDSLTNGQLDALDTAMHTMLSVVGQGFALARWGRYTGVKVAAIDDVGEYLTDARTKVRAVPFIGTQNGPLPQSSVCLSFRAATAIGPATKGRMFIPYTSAVSWDDGVAPRIGTGLVQNIATYGAAFIKDVNAAFNGMTPQPTARIYQVTGPNATAPAHSSEIVEVRCGDVVDTQRKRRNRIQEIYKVAVVP